eukprot:symbB.v1.2.033213.t1/scaffold4097.1/size44767/2
MTSPAFSFQPAHRGVGSIQLSWAEQARFGGQLLRYLWTPEQGWHDIISSPNNEMQSEATGSVTVPPNEDEDENCSESEQGDTLGQLPVLPVRISPQPKQQMALENRLRVTDKMTTLRVRSMGGDALMEMQIGSWHVLSLPMKYFVSGRLGMLDVAFDLIFEQHLLGLDDKLGKLISDVPEDGIDLLLVRSDRIEEAMCEQMFSVTLDEFEDTELSSIGRVPLVRHGVKYRAENSGQL